MKIKKVAKKNPRTKETKYYPALVGGEFIDRDRIARRIEKRSTVSSSDILAVLDALQYEIIDVLTEGRSVRLGILGSFHPTISGAGKATLKEVTVEDVKRVRVHFTASTTVKNELALNRLHFEMVTPAEEKKPKKP